MKYLFLLAVLNLSAFATIESRDHTGNIFGSYGYIGSSGMTGRPGYNGQDQTVTATGSPLNLDLSGTSGDGGYDGSYGGNATNCYQPQNTTYNLQGASGGAGGSGGDGGWGGHSGNLTVYYNSLNDLKQVYVRATPGRGGYGGYGGRGGVACRCYVHQWTLTVSGQPQTYYCYDGYEGDNGRHGNNAINGNYGSVILIGQTTPLLPTQTSLSMPMQNILSGPFKLSNNEWETKTGTKNLFASGSQLNDTYRMFKQRVEKQYQMKWQVDRPLTDFMGKQLNLSLSGQSIALSLPADVWHLGHEEAEVGNLKTYVFDGALHFSEATDLKINKIGGSGSALYLNVIDNADNSDIVKTTYSIVYSTKALLIYYQRYNGVVPSSLVTQTGNEFRLAIGKLNISSKFLSSGNDARVYLYATRSYGSHKTVKTMAVEFEIP